MGTNIADLTHCRPGLILARPFLFLFFLALTVLYCMSLYVMYGVQKLNVKLDSAYVHIQANILSEVAHP